MACVAASAFELTLAYRLPGLDINPNNHGTFIAGTGQEIVAPKALQEYQPRLVVAMNPVYREEIGQDLDKMGLTAELTTIEHGHEDVKHLAFGG